MGRNKVGDNIQLCGTSAFTDTESEYSPLTFMLISAKKLVLLVKNGLHYFQVEGSYDYGLVSEWPF